MSSKTSASFLIDPYGIVVDVLKDFPKDDNITALTYGLTWQDDKDDFLIYVVISPRLFDSSKTKQDAVYLASLRSLIIVHEAVHVKQFLEKAIDSKLDNETEAYLVQHICIKVTEAVNKIWKDK